MLDSELHFPLLLHLRKAWLSMLELQKRNLVRGQKTWQGPLSCYLHMLLGEIVQIRGRHVVSVTPSSEPMKPTGC